MLSADLDAVLAVQAACYPLAMQEARAVVEARLRSASATCVVGDDDEGVCAYLFATPSRLGAVTGLGAPFLPVPHADTLYLHDLSVAPRAHGRGLARALVAHLLAAAHARGLAHAALVSVQDSARFWEGIGFRAAPRAGRPGHVQAGGCDPGLASGSASGFASGSASGPASGLATGLATALASYPGRAIYMTRSLGPA